MEFKQELLAVINPGIERYRTAGQIAGRKAADRFVGYCIARPRDRDHTIKSIAVHTTNLINASCETMRKVGATEPNLTAWTESYLSD
jgi:hypothetical protein